jgi:hypothetical protein
MIIRSFPTGGPKRSRILIVVFPLDCRFLAYYFFLISFIAFLIIRPNSLSFFRFSAYVIW